ncbi:cytochrome p450 4a12 [Plakobranchus ocellatus]|uniref:Cytochrome p450 4a12 n=1 Tax=Plakobranchus ocellatus TaxID=259542 RepID=A0AAV3YG47_9GAST|nr:cytochrome p450 4a12 [Plakobranchus ocellatus]
MWFIRRMMRISWTENNSNESFLKEAYLERSLVKTIRQRQLQFLVHICRHKGLEHLAITGKIEGKRNKGRQRRTFIENLKSWAIGKGSNNNFIRLTEDRFEWRNMIANIYSRQAKNLQAFFYALARNPEKQEKLYREIVEVVGESGPVSNEKLSRMPYLKACLKESFRYTQWFQAQEKRFNFN